MKWNINTLERIKNRLFLDSFGYSVYSQNDEDGIIQEIFQRIGTTNKKFIEFGVGNGLECNTHYLLLLGWSGLWIEGSNKAYKKINSFFIDAIQTGILKIINIFITKDNINDLIKSSGFEDEIDLLTIDVDGNDYHILEKISQVNPRVIIIEYNGWLPPECDWVMPYDAEFVWSGDDYYGASLLALERLCNKKGYQLVGTNVTGVNAFFVRKDLVQNLFPLPATAENLYNPHRRSLCFYRETQLNQGFLLNKQESRKKYTENVTQSKWYILFCLPYAIIKKLYRFTKDSL